MLPLADIVGTRPTAPVDAITPIGDGTDSRQEILQRLSQIAIGTRLDAAVLSQLDDGTYLVRIADTAARMNLPTGTRVGTSLSMTMLAAQPRPTFLLEGQTGSTNTNFSSAARIINNVLQQAQQQNLAPVINGKTPIVSNAALLLSSSLTPQLATALQNSVAFSGAFYESHLQQWSSGSRTLIDVLREPQAQTSKIAVPAALANQNLALDELAQLVQASKMLSPEAVKNLDLSPQKFAEWVKANISPSPQNTSTLDSLQQKIPEIFAQLVLPDGESKQDATQKATQESIHNDLAKLLQNTKAISPELLERLNLPHSALAEIVTQIRDATVLEKQMLDSSANQQLPSSSSSVQTDAEVLANAYKQTPISAESAQLINIQLNALEQKQLVWQGQLFPGQPMEWEIQDQTPRQQGEESPQAAWKSTVRFSLPTLGDISATIHLIGDQVHVQVNTSTEAVASSLREHSNALAHALGAAGSPLESLIIKNDEKS